jgi:secreted trypsin-like serine protease
MDWLKRRPPRVPSFSMACSTASVEIGMSTPSVIDENWNSYARDPSGTCHGDSGAPTFFDGEDGHGAQVIDIASDGNADCATGDVRARVDTPEDARGFSTR